MDTQDGTGPRAAMSPPGHVCIECKPLQGPSPRLESLLKARKEILDEHQKETLALYLELDDWVRAEERKPKAASDLHEAGKPKEASEPKAWNVGGVEIAKPKPGAAVRGHMIDMVDADVKQSILKKKWAYTKEAEESQKEILELMEKLFQGAPFKGKLAARIRRHLHVTKLRGKAARQMLKELEKEAKKFGWEHGKKIGADIVKTMFIESAALYVKKAAEQEIDNGDKAGAMFLLTDYLILQAFSDATDPFWWWDVGKDVVSGKSIVTSINERFEERPPMKAAEAQAQNTKRALNELKAAAPIKNRLP